MSQVISSCRRVRNKRSSRTAIAGTVQFLFVLVFLLSLLGMNPGRAAAAPTTYYVDNTNVSCSDAGPGTLAQPFCRIMDGAAAAVAGDTVRVLAGSYAETVKPSASGSSGLPITYSAAAGVVVTGDGTATGSAFRMTGLSYITIDGFTVSGTAETGIYVSGSNFIISHNQVSGTVNHGIYALSASNVTISNNTISSAGGSGIYLKTVTTGTVSGNMSHDNLLDGIRLTGSTGISVSDNTTFANNGAKSNGVALLTASNGNTVSHNIAYANTDSGLQVEGSSGNTVSGNLSYANGDHGIDVTGGSPDNIVVGNTFQGNFTSGINLEMSAGGVGSTGTTIANNVLVDNGLNPSGGRKPGNIYVDPKSVTGTTIDYDLFSTTGAYQINWDGTGYSSLAAFQAVVPSQEVHGWEGDPLFVAPAAPATDPPSVATGDYHIQVGSPAIDSANSAASGETSTDIEGNARVDDPATPNTGAGTPAYYDRGAYEFQPPPVSRFAISGNAGVAGAVLSYMDGTPKTATADGSGDYSFSVPSNWSGTVTPSLTGYTFSPPSLSYTNVVADQTAQDYTATPNTYTLTYAVGAHGSINGATQQTVSYGGSGTPVTAVPDSGYYFLDWSDALTTNPRTDAHVTGDISVTANFRPRISSISPTGTLASWNGVFTWTGVAGATSYALEVYNSSGTRIYNQSPAASSACVSLNCSYTASTLANLANGSYTWRVRDYGPYGAAGASMYGPWTEPLAFTIARPCYSLTTAVIPAAGGKINVRTAQNCTGGYLPGTVVTVKLTITRGQLFMGWSGDASGTLATVYVSMDGNRSVIANFRSPASPISPTGALTSWDGVFTWTGVPDATSYTLDVYNAKNKLIDTQTLAASTVCTGLQCSYTDTTLANLANSSYSWRVRDYGPYGTAGSYMYGPPAPLTKFSLSR